MKPQKLKKTERDNKDVIIENQKTQIMGLRKKIQILESKLIALGH